MDLKFNASGKFKLIMIVCTETAGGPGVMSPVLRLRVIGSLLVLRYRGNALASCLPVPRWLGLMIL